MKNGRAAGPDDVPPDVWKIVSTDVHACQALLDVCQRCWTEKSIPEKWRMAYVLLLFKKGDTQLYRTIIAR
eukprot:8840247-Pyramimonas_sp.AAC.1